MSIVSRLCTRYLRIRSQRRFIGIYRSFREFTMVPERVFTENLELAQTVADVPGCVVECGVWRGGMSAGLAALFGSGRKYYLFDSFAGLPPAREIDGPAALDWQRDTHSPTYYQNCAASPDFADRAMRLAGANEFYLVPGWFNASLPRFVPPEPLALLRLDADWYDSTMLCLESLFRYVTPGGLIIIGDYYTWDGCSRAVHDYLSRHSAPERINSYGSIGYIRKRQSQPGP